MVENPFASIQAEVARLAPATGVIDAHTHLGVDEDGHSLTQPALLAALDEIDRSARAVVFPLHDPERTPAYRVPNDRVLQWCGDSDGRLIPYCRLDPGEEPVAELERCLALGARGIKLHPRAQEFGSGHDGLAQIFAVAEDRRVPILLHAGRGMPTMDWLVELAWRFPEVPLVLAHAGIADQALFAARLADHPCTLYDTSAFRSGDIVELFARVPAERIVFASDVPYGRPAGGLFSAMRAAQYAGLDAAERALVAGGTMAAVLDGDGPPPARPPRVSRIRPVNGGLMRVAAYLDAAFAAIIAVGPPDAARALPWITLAWPDCRDPDPGPAGPALERIAGLLEAAERRIAERGDSWVDSVGMLICAATIAATEPLDGVLAATA